MPHSTANNNNKLRKQLVLLAVAALLAGCGSAGGPSASAPQQAATVNRVVDGDTIIANLGGKAVRVRFIGMDTPETVDPKKPVGCFGPEASKYTKSLLPAGTPIELVYDVERKDVYGRTLAYVYRKSDHLFIDAELVRQGYAQTLTIPPNVAHVDDFTQLATEAREQNRGLWSAC